MRNNFKKKKFVLETKKGQGRGGGQRGRKVEREEGRKGGTEGREETGLLDIHSLFP